MRRNTTVIRRLKALDTFTRRGLLAHLQDRIDQAPPGSLERTVAELRLKLALHD